MTKTEGRVGRGIVTDSSSEDGRLPWWLFRAYWTRGGRCPSCRSTEVSARGGEAACRSCAHEWEQNSADLAEARPTPDFGKDAIGGRHPGDDTTPSLVHPLALSGREGTSL